VPARLDRLPWRPLHAWVVVALGISWILDGLEIQIIFQISTVLEKQGTLHLTATETGYITSCYLFGEVIGALLFGRITDQLGRKKLFFVTAAGVMMAAGGVITWYCGVDAERKPLEGIAHPLSAVTRPIEQSLESA